MAGERIVYVDSSAIVKLAVREPESGALRQYLRRRRPLVCSALARTEVVRAVLPLGPPAVRRAREVLSRFDLVRLSDRILAAAAELEPYHVRSLDAIHLATARLLGDTLRRIVTYDDRMTGAARHLGFTVVSPR